jgi:hypothetical protein
LSTKNKDKEKEKEREKDREKGKYGSGCDSSNKLIPINNKENIPVNAPSGKRNNSK